MTIKYAFDVPFVAALSLKEKQIQQNYHPIIEDRLSDAWSALQGRDIQRPRPSREV